MVESSEEGSEEGVRFSDIDFSGIVHVEFIPGSWEEFGHVGFHLSLRNLFGNQEDFSAGFLAAFSVKNVLSGSLSSGVGNWDGVMVENVVHDIILVSTVVSRGRSISGGWRWFVSIKSLSTNNAESRKNNNR